MRYFALPLAALTALTSGACATAGLASDGQPGAVDDAHPGDGRRPIDAPGTLGGSDAPVMTGGTASHLLLSEICLSPTGSEFIELMNPTGQAVDLSHYYLSDNGNYFKLPGGSPTLTSGDFIVQFKSGSSIAAGGVVTVAIGSASAFTTAFGAAPTYSIFDATVTVTASNGSPSLTDSGEIVILFNWDGSAADLVKDVDIMIAGNATVGNGLVTKSNIAVGGSSYGTDANTIAPQGSSPTSGSSTKRIGLEASHETQAGTGNGITGDDETSENTALTWDTTFTAPTPGTVPAAL